MCHWPLCGNSLETSEFPTQMASNAENVSIWWLHHVLGFLVWVTWQHMCYCAGAWSIMLTLSIGLFFFKERKCIPTFCYFSTPRWCSWWNDKDRLSYILSTPCLLMPWWSKEPGHRQQWYWPNSLEISCPQHHTRRGRGLYILCQVHVHGTGWHGTDFISQIKPLSNESQTGFGFRISHHQYGIYNYFTVLFLLCKITCYIPLVFTLCILYRVSKISI